MKGQPNPQLTPLQREAIRILSEGGMKPAHIARVLGTSRVSVYKWARTEKVQ